MVSFCGFAPFATSRYHVSLTKNQDIKQESSLNLLWLLSGAAPAVSVSRFEIALGIEVKFVRMTASKRPPQINFECIETYDGT